MFNRQSKCKFMKRFRFPACLIAMLSICIHSVAGQTKVPGAQNNAGEATNNGARASNARPIGPISQNVGRGAIGTTARTAYSRPTQTVVQRPVNSRSNYSASGRPLNRSLAATSARQVARTYNVQPVAELAKNDVVQPGVPPVTNPQRILRPYDLQPARNIPGRENVARATRDVPTGGKIVQSPSDELAPRERSQSKRRHNWHGNKDHLNYSDASRRHRHEWRDRNWWKKNCETIVFVNSGYYFLDAGYWYPAWGYDPLNSYYDYDGPIYTYGNLLPDQVIANVQEALQDAGYYFGPVTGSLSVETRAALANFQRDYGLLITGAIDQPTVETLGLY
jgi:hypothetical protein